MTLKALNLMMPEPDTEEIDDESIITKLVSPTILSHTARAHGTRDQTTD
jgi:hypothetical protein